MRGWITHLTIVWVWGILFSFLPVLIGGLPLQQQLSSDAEWYTAALMRSADPPRLAADPSMPLDIRPAGEAALTTLLARVADGLGLGMLDWSVALSFFSLLLFLGSIYVLVRVAVGPTAALIVAVASVVEVHALGGTTFGFQVLGYLPRDLLLGPAVLAVVAYSLALRRHHRAMAFVFLGCGLAANVYPLLFAHLALCLGLAEVIRLKRIDRWLVIYAAVAFLGALPAVVDATMKAAAAGPIDAEIARLRLSYLVVDSIPTAVTQYLRRTIIYAFLVLGIWIGLSGERTGALRTKLTPWFALATSSLVLSIAGVVIESTVPATMKYLLSRTSLFFILAAMIIVAGGLPGVLRLRGRWASATATGLVIGVFAFQAGIFSVARAIADTRGHLGDRQAFQAAAIALRDRTVFGDLVIAPSDESPDVAASVRTYSQRGVWQSYKDLGVAQVDGRRGRVAFDRWMTMQDVLKGRDLDRLLVFMRSEGIRAALIPDSLAPLTTGRYEVTRTRGYAIVDSR